MPFAAPIFNHKELAAMTTWIDANGVCRQSAGYTCGPASAVTALRLLGLPAEEGQIAILSRTSAFAGTPPDLLAQALRERYAASGLISECRAFHHVAELKDAGLTLAVISYGPMTDHYVTVLKVTNTDVIVGDPLNGREYLFRMRILKINGASSWRCGAEFSTGVPSRSSARFWRMNRS